MESPKPAFLMVSWMPTSIAVAGSTLAIGALRTYVRTLVERSNHPCSIKLHGELLKIVPNGAVPTSEN